jgi:hypothetical protein
MDNTLDSGDCSRPAVIIRPIGEGDSLESLTAMLHRAFSRLGAAGLNRPPSRASALRAAHVSSPFPVPG